MARYRQKSEEDLRWNSIRRRITREVDLQIAEYREALLNRLLTSAFDQFTEALATGKVLELEARYESSFVREVLGEVITVDVDHEQDAAA